jgi:hypothetical protein
MVSEIRRANINRIQSEESRNATLHIAKSDGRCAQETRDASGNSRSAFIVDYPTRIGKPQTLPEFAAYVPGATITDYSEMEEPVIANSGDGQAGL